MSTKTSSMELVWRIRDSVGFTANEKAFLFVVASRGTMFAKWQTASRDMGMSKDTYYRTRNSLIEKDALNVRRQMDGPTVYTVNVEALDSQDENKHSHSANTVSQLANGGSRIPETKVTIKTTNKVTVKKMPRAVADATVVREREVYSPSKTSGAFSDLHSTKEYDGAAGEVTSNPDSHIENGPTLDEIELRQRQRELAASFGETFEQTARRLERESGTLGDDW